MRWYTVVLVPAALCLAACNEVVYPTANALRVSTSTTGLDTPVGPAYAFTVDNGPPQAVGSLPVTVGELPSGSHTVALVKAPRNCGVDGENPRAVLVSGDRVTSVVFTITCLAETGLVEVTAATTGLDFPPKYQLDLDGKTQAQVTPNAAWTMAALSAGQHTVRLTVSGNCSLADPDTVRGSQSTHTVTITTGGLSRDTARTMFEVSCTATTGIIEVGTVTSGQSLERDGYRVNVTGAAAAQGVGVNGITRFVGLAEGDHDVKLDSVASNCAVADSNPRTLHITTGGLTRDTARTTFQVSCQTIPYAIAFTRAGKINVALADGSNAISLTDGIHPAWSPDGTTLVYTRQECSYDNYYGSYCSQWLSVIGLDGTGSKDLTDGSDYDYAAWSPDGAKIAFVTSGHLYLMNTDGSGRTEIPLPDSVASPSELAWSPDAKQIAFSCTVITSWRDICVVGADGTSFRRITNDPWSDAKPSWSPEGSRIAFTTNRDTPDGHNRIAVTNTDGSGFAALADGWAPSWSHDGSKIGFVRGGSSPGLFVINPDGSGLGRLTSGSDDDPAWRP